MTKPTKWHVRPAKNQISLGIRPVWSESSLSAWRKLWSLATHWAHSEDSDQTGAQSDLSLRWVHSHFVGFVMRRFILLRIYQTRFYWVCSWAALVNATLLTPPSRSFSGTVYSAPWSQRIRNLNCTMMKYGEMFRVTTRHLTPTAVKINNF